MFNRVVVPATVIAATLAIALVLAPSGAIGDVGRAEVASAADRYTFGQDVDVNRPVSGSMFVFGGSANINDVINGDLLVLGGSIVFGGRGRVTGNVIYSGGRVVDGEGRIGGRSWALSSVEGAAASLQKTAVIVSLLFFWIIGAVLLTLASAREVRASSVELRASALHCFTLGLVATTSFVLTALVFSYLIPFLIGIPLLAGLGVFAALTKIYGMVAVFHAMGTIIAGYRTREQLAGRKWLRGDLAMVLAGIAILGAIRLIPVVGTIVWSLASVFGVGVALATKFGRREPWFLAWRPAEA
jgi:preprotein translocase subunit SecG